MSVLPGLPPNQVYADVDKAWWNPPTDTVGLRQKSEVSDCVGSGGKALSFSINIHAHTCGCSISQGLGASEEVTLRFLPTLSSSTHGVGSICQGSCESKVLGELRTVNRNYLKLENQLQHESRLSGSY